MKVLYITRKFPPSLGGMQKMNYNLVKHLSSKLDLTLISWGGPQFYLLFFLIFAYFKAVSLSKNNFDLLFLGDTLLAPLGSRFGKKFNVKTVCVAHGLDVLYPLGIYQHFVVKGLRELDAVICVSRATQEQCASRGVKNTIVIPNGVDTPQSAEQPSLDFLLPKSAQAKKIILSVGRLVRRKGIAEFIQKVVVKLKKQRSDFIYLVVGEGKEKKNIQRIINKHQLNDTVFLLGRCPDVTLAKLFRNATIFVMPNIPCAGDMEGFGIVALEASSYGTPVVASDIEGLQDAVSNGKNGLLVPYDDSELFIQKIEYLFDNQQARRLLSESAMRYAKENFSWDTISERYISVFKELERS